MGRNRNLKNRGMRAGKVVDNDTITTYTSDSGYCSDDNDNCGQCRSTAIIPYSDGNTYSRLMTEHSENVVTTAVGNDILTSIALIGFGISMTISPIAITGATSGINFSADVSEPSMRGFNCAWVAPRNGVLKNLACNFNNLTVSTVNVGQGTVYNLHIQIFIASTISNVYTPTQLRATVGVPIPVGSLNAEGAPQPVFISGPFSSVNYSFSVPIAQMDRVMLIAYATHGTGQGTVGIDVKCNISGGVEFECIEPFQNCN